MPCPVMSFNGFIRDWINYIILRIAWLAADILGWRAALSVYPAVMRGKVAIVTGANAGLGLEVAKALLQQGATVVMGCRSLEHAQMAREDILRDTQNYGPIPDAPGRLIPLHLDLEDFPSVKQFVSDFHALNLPLHVLVNNAGVHLKPHKRVSLGFERTQACNYFAPFWLTQLLLDDLKASAPARVVNVSSISEQLGLFALYTPSIPYDDIPGHHLGTDSGEKPYVMAKTFSLMSTTRELAKRLEGTGVDVIAVHPGIADSTWYLKSDNESYLFSWLVDRARALVGPQWVRVGQKVTTGAISLIYASIEPSLVGSTSNPKSTGIIDNLIRMLFGGRLRYYGPSYIPLFLNWNNAGRCYAWNPWVYSKQACSRLYDATMKLMQDVEQQLSQQQQQEGGSTNANITAAGLLNGNDAKFSKSSAAVEAPLGMQQLQTRM